MAERKTGTVKWFDSKKGYGLITREQGQDVFVHYNDIRGPGHPLLEGQRVEFKVVQAEKGPQAQDVVVLS